MQSSFSIGQLIPVAALPLAINSNAKLCSENPCSWDESTTVHSESESEQLTCKKKEKRKQSIRSDVDTRIPAQMTLVLCIQFLLLSLTLTVSQDVFEARNEGVITSWNSQFIAYPMLNSLPCSVPPMLDSFVCDAHYLFIESFILSLTHSSRILSRAFIPTSMDLRIFRADVIIWSNDYYYHLLESIVIFRCLLFYFVSSIRYINDYCRS